MTSVIERPSAPQSPHTPSLASRLKPNLETLPTLAAIVIFVGMIIYGEIAYGRILQFSTLSNLFINNAYLIILAVGLTFVILTGGVDLSVGAIIAISSLVGVMLANAGWNPLRRDRADDPHRLGLRSRLGNPDPVLQRATVHRDARDDVPGPGTRIHAEHHARAARRRLAHPHPVDAVEGDRRAEDQRPRSPRPT